jgi:hypothetical protein
MAKITITIEDTDTGIQTKLETSEDLPSDVDDYTQAQIVGVGTYGLMYQELETAEQIDAAFSAAKAVSADAKLLN